jgi:hypothetical protein
MAFWNERCCWCWLTSSPSLSLMGIDTWSIFSFNQALTQIVTNGRCSLCAERTPRRGSIEELIRNLDRVNARLGSFLIWTFSPFLLFLFYWGWLFCMTINFVFISLSPNIKFCDCFVIEYTYVLIRNHNY